MKRQKIKKVILTMVIIAFLLPLVSLANTVEGKNELVLNAKLSTEEWTNEDVIVDIEGLDLSNSIGISHLTLPNNEIISASRGNVYTISGSFTATTNGGYMFLLERNNGNSIGKTVQIKNIDKDKPGLILNDRLEDGAVLVEILANDETSGVKEVILPNGKKWDNVNDYKIEENGEFSFKVIDNAGNETIKVLIVDNLSLAPIEITIKPYNEEWTRDSVLVEAIVNRGVLNQDSKIFAENGRFMFTAEDRNGDRARPIMVTISNIDKTPPTPPRVIINKLSHRIEISHGVDNQSGLRETLYSLNNKDWIKVNDTTIDLSSFNDGNYKIAVRTIDKAGNESSSEVSFKIEYTKMIKEAKLGIVTAKSLDDTNTVSDLLKSIPNSKEKEELIKKLNDKIIQIEKLNTPKENTESSIKRAESAVTIAERNPREAFIRNARAVVNKLSDSPEKTNLLSRVDLIGSKGIIVPKENTESSIKRAENAVAIAERNPREAFIKNARAVVNKLSDGPEKTDLLSRVQLIGSEGIIVPKENTKSSIKRAENAVAIAERNPREAFIKNAMSVVSKLSDSPEKTDLLSRVQLIN